MYLHDDMHFEFKNYTLSRGRIQLNWERNNVEQGEGPTPKPELISFCLHANDFRNAWSSHI